MSRIPKLTTKDIKQIRGGWYSIAVVTIEEHIRSKCVPVREDGRVIEALYFDLSVSKTDKRDWVISQRSDVYLEQEQGFIAAYSKNGYSKDELKQEIVNLANEWIDDNVETERFDRLPENYTLNHV